MASAATGSFAAVERTTARRAAVEGVACASGLAPVGGVVLLSPAAPSFGLFGDYRERSAAFAAAAGRLGALS